MSQIEPTLFLLIEVVSIFFWLVVGYVSVTDNITRLTIFTKNQIYLTF